MTLSAAAARQGDCALLFVSFLRFLVRAWVLTTESIDIHFNKQICLTLAKKEAKYTTLAREEEEWRRNRKKNRKIPCIVFFRSLHSLRSREWRSVMSLIISREIFSLFAFNFKSSFSCFKEQYEISSVLIFSCAALSACLREAHTACNASCCLN